MNTLTTLTFGALGSIALLACGPGGGSAGSFAPLPAGDLPISDGFHIDSHAPGGDIPADPGAGPDVSLDAQADDSAVPSCVPICQPGACGSDGCGGVCGVCQTDETCTSGVCVAGLCGSGGGPYVVGNLKTPSPVEFSDIAVSLTHKMDVDPHEDGCVTNVTVTLGKQFGCTLRIEAGSIIAADGSFPITRVEFTADSQCPGFDDDEEGLYNDLSGLTAGRVIPGILTLPVANAPQACVATGFRIELAGQLRNATQVLTLGPTTFDISGEFMSQGSTQESCPCVRECSGAVCGDDGCGGSCGNCGDGQACNEAAGVCSCAPDCAGKSCGDDGCGGSCGSCSGFDGCVQGQCAPCTPQCTDKSCGDDGCGGNCGTCPQNTECGGNGQCQCVPNCDGKFCGGDGCGGICGTCGGSSECASNGTCTCFPQCVTGSCSDGCGGLCGGGCGGGLACNHASGECQSGLGSCDYSGLNMSSEWVNKDGDTLMIVQNTATDALGFFDQLQIEVRPDSSGKYPGLLSTTSIGADPNTCTTCVSILVGCLPDQGCTKHFFATSGTVFWLAFGANFGFLRGTLDANLEEVSSFFEPIPGGQDYCVSSHDLDLFH